MALISVSELMTDPDFVNTVLVITRVSTVNQYGENSLTESTATTVGSVQPANGKEIERLPEALRTKNVRKFWIKGDISTGSSGGGYPAILSFAGKRYQVIQVFDWSNFGQGYNEGLCVAEEVNA
jgi:hypothetical protein